MRRLVGAGLILVIVGLAGCAMVASNSRKRTVPSVAVIRSLQ